MSTVENWYFHLFKWDKIATWQEVQAISAKYERCMVHFEDEGMFPKVHWMILEDSGRFRARTPLGVRVKAY